MYLRIFSILAVLSGTTALSAQETGDGISFRLGLGAQSKPEYFGSDENQSGVTGGFKFDQLQLGEIEAGGPKTGLGFGGSVRVIGERSAENYEELEGLEDIDAAIELGGGLRFSQPGYKLFANLRYGVIGHESIVGEIGGDVYYRPTEKVTLSAGPRVLWGSDDYAQTYFGVSAEEEAASDFTQFDAGSGIISQGVQARATYDFNDDWGVQGTIRYNQLREDAADSPITQSEDQVSGSIVVMRRITFGF